MKKSILIFDDDLDVLEVCKLILEQHNYIVETRTNCVDVIEDVIKISPDIIMMDLWIPDEGGEAATKKIKNNLQIKNIPVILFSANANVEQICKTSQANGFLKKPFEIENLLTVLQKEQF